MPRSGRSPGSACRPARHRPRSAPRPPFPGRCPVPAAGARPRRRQPRRAPRRRRRAETTCSPPATDTRCARTPVRTAIPSRRSASASSSDTWASSRSASREAPCTIVTSSPKRRMNWASSTPTGPPPSTTAERGSSCSAVASRLVQKPTSNGPSIGGTPGPRRCTMRTGRLCGVRRRRGSRPGEPARALNGHARRRRAGALAPSRHRRGHVVAERPDPRPPRWRRRLRRVARAVSPRSSAARSASWSGCTPSCAHSPPISSRSISGTRRPAACSA